MPNEYQRADHERRIHRLEEDNKKIFSSLDDIKKRTTFSRFSESKNEFYA